MSVKCHRKRVLKRWMKVNPSLRTVRAIMREHLAFARMTITGDLSSMLGLTPDSARSFMTKTNPIAPQYVDLFIERMKLDEWDANELRLRGAIEAGWQIDVKLLKEKPA